jgi:hypothetical protein
MWKAYNKRIEDEKKIPIFVHRVLMLIYTKEKEI